MRTVKSYNLKTIVLVLMVLCAMPSCAQSNDKHFGNVSPTHESAVAYKLIPTQNMWTFIKLDTRNGQLWQVQFDVKGSNRFTSDLSSQLLVAKDDEVNGRFHLYPTQNVYTFILLDQIDGRTWQVQWAIDYAERGIVPIE